MRPIRIVTSSVLGLGVLLLAGSAMGYSFMLPRRTWDCPPNYTVDDTGIPSVADGDGGATRVVQAINLVTSTSDGWNDAGAGRIVSAHKGSTSSFALGDGVPMIKFSDPLGACTDNCLALAYHLYYSPRAAGAVSHRIDDADIVINLAYNWTSEGEDPGGVGCSTEVYIEGVMMHEVGYGLGLDTSNIPGATMSPSVSYCSNSPATLETDDVNGILALYGTAPCNNSLFNPCIDYTQYLTGDADADVQPCAGSFTLGGSGTIKGWVEGPSDTDFDLYLEKLTTFGVWIQVAKAESASSSEAITYSGTAGTYRFRVVSFSGKGTYHFWYQRPVFFP